MGAFTLLVGFAPATLFGMAVVGMSLAGFMNPIVNGPLMALLQSRVPADKQGRIFTLINSGSTAMMPLGIALAAPVAENLGIQAWFIAGGFITVLMGIAGFLIPVIYNIEADPLHPPIQAAPVPQPVPEAG
jgi:DHA3 family macrolide efflux protein-like MFS transporter